MSERLINYPHSAEGNFYAKDTIGVPHPYCIGEKHVVHAADHFSGMLGKEALASAERAGIRCAVKGCKLSYDEHEQAILVGCRAPLKDDKGEVNPELHEWLLSIKDQAMKDGFAGFAFLDETRGEKQ